MFLKRNLTLALFVWLAIMPGMQGCEPPPGPPDFILEHEVFPQPPRVGQVTITLKLTDAAKTSLTGAHVELEGNMLHAGMAPVFAEAKETEPGHYRSTMELSMAGDWFVLVTVTLADSRKYGRQFEIKGVAPREL